MNRITLKNALLVIAGLVIVLGGWIRYAQVANYNFPFTTDQARDMLDLRNIVAGHHLTLVGPTTSINGVFLGPSYYYFNVIPFLLGQGDPSYLVYWNLFFYLIASVLLLSLHFKKEAAFGFFASILFIMAPGYFQSTRYFWNSHSMIYFSLFYFISLAFFLQNSTSKKAIWLGFISGICMQFQAAFGILLLPFALISSGFKKVGWKLVALQIAGFGITLLPQILFEIKHQFGMTKLFIAEISGSGHVLGEKMTFFESVLSHLNSFIFFSHGIMALPFSLDSVILLAAIGFLGLKIYQKKLNPLLKIYTLVSTGFLIFAFVFYSFYLHELKDWFILGLRIPYLLLMASFLTAVYHHTLEKKTYRHIPQTVTIAVLLLSVFFAVQDQMQFVPKNGDVKSDDKSNMKNSLQAVDWVYQHINGKGFKAYNYIPSVYDYPYQYIYWWYGTKKYGYQPAAISYKDDVPEYITNNSQFLTKTKPQEDNLIALIYEDDPNTDLIFGWGGNFTKYCRITDIKYNWGTTAEIRRPCNPGEDSPRLEPARK